MGDQIVKKKNKGVVTQLYINMRFSPLGRLSERDINRPKTKLSSLFDSLNPRPLEGINLRRLDDTQGQKLAKMRLPYKKNGFAAAIYLYVNSDCKSTSMH